MFRKHRQYLNFFILVLFIPVVVSAEGIVDVGLFSKSGTDAVLPAGWEPLNLGGSEYQSKYSLVKDNGVYVVRAESQAAASAMFYPLKIDLNKTPIIQWRWKIDHTVRNGNALDKDGDDYPARLYILFDYDISRLSWLEKVAYESYRVLYGHYPPLAALNYLWANKLPIGSLIPNIYSDRVKMFAVRSGDEEAGEWRVEKRNIHEDYLQAFGEEPPAILGIAIMTDTDNTGEQAVAYYGDIKLLAKK